MLLKKYQTGGKVLKKYKTGGKAKKKRDPVEHKSHREIALGVYKKQMEGKPLVGYEKEYSKSGSYRAFQKTKPYNEVGHLKVTGQTGDAPKPKRLGTEFGRSAGASPLAKAKADIKKKRKAKGLQKGGKVGKAGTQKEVNKFMMHQKREVLRRKKINEQTAKDEEYYAERLEKSKKLNIKLDPNEQKWLDEYKMKKGTERKPLKIRRAKGLQKGGKVLKK